MPRMLKRLPHLLSLGFLLSLACGPDKPPVSPITEAEVVEPPGPPAPAPTESAAPAPEPAAAAPAPDSNGETRTSEVIAQVIRDNRQPFRDCYEKGKKKIPELEGTLTLYFVLNPKGEVKTAELNRERSDIVEPVVVDCALGVLKAMKFPRSSRGMESTVNYPFDFKR
jgi:hypothetical protein